MESQRIANSRSDLADPEGIGHPGRVSSSTMPLSDAEFRELLVLLRRFSETDLDQFAHLRFGSFYGEVFVSIARAPEAGATAIAYSDVSNLLAGDDN
jgi:hypothetical protein